MRLREKKKDYGYIIKNGLKGIEYNICLLFCLLLFSFRIVD